MKKLFVIVAGILLVLGMSFKTSAVDVTANFMWSHDIPPDIAKYTIYDVSSEPRTVASEYPYTFEGLAEKDFVHQVTIAVPAGITVNKCFVITASDLSENESADSEQACREIFIKDTEAPPACKTFDFNFVQ